MRREDIISLLGKDWDSLSTLCRQAIATDIELLSSLNNYVYNNSGKRLRPMLALLTGRICGTVTNDCICCAAAAEILHNATLMHDDVADRSSTRRGKPSLTAMVGPEAAVLVGDFWLSRALGLIMGTKNMDRTVRLFSRTLSDLAEGEMLQLQLAENGLTTEEDYLRVIHCKTASLFEVTCLTAAISVDAPKDLEDAVAQYGKATGIAFQIKDDILDYCGEQTGKPVGQDIKEKKITMPLLGAMMNSSREDEIREAVRTLDPEDSAACDRLHAFVLDNGGVDYAAARLQDYIDEAVSALDIFPDTPEKQALVELARYNAMRKS